MTFSSDNRRLMTLGYQHVSTANRRSDVFKIWDLKTGDELLSRTYYGGGGVGGIGFRLLPNSERLLGIGYFGLPQFWDGTPVARNDEP